MAVVQSITAKLLIQIGADEPKEIGTIEIPIELSIPVKASSVPQYPAGVRTAEAQTSVRP